MGLNYVNLDEATRAGMVSEIETDIEEKSIHLSNYLTEEGQRIWPEMILEAAKTGDDDSLASEIRRRGVLKHQAERRKPKGGFTMAKVPHNAAETLGEGEFGRYYARGLCLRAQKEGIQHLEVYRAKEVREPRPGSQEKIGTLVDPTEILNDLRETNGVEPALGMPPGPNSGLTLKIPG